ncbi:hypothetical protein OAF05_01035 [bacterium]|nr:hypothetical protein [bacterium]
MLMLPNASAAACRDRSLRDGTPTEDELLQWQMAEGRWKQRLAGTGRQLSLAVGQIAAFAAAQGLVLVRRNASDFSALTGLQIHN